MALFATDLAAEQRARAKGPAGDNTWVYAFSGKDTVGQPIVTAYRPISLSGGPGWFSTSDDATV